MESVKKNKTKNSIRGSIFGILYKLIGIIFPFVIRTIIIYFLGSDYAGLGSLFISILSILSLSELGIGSAMVFCLYKPINDENYELVSRYMAGFKIVYRIIGLVILVLGIVVLPFVPYLIAGDVPNDINVYILFSVYLTNTCISYFFFSYRTSLLNAYQKSDLVSNAGTISSLFLYIAQIIVLIVFKNYYFYISFLPISTVLNNVFIYIFSRKYYLKLSSYSYVKYDRGLMKGLFKNVGFLFGHRLGSVLIASLDNVVISSILGLVQLTIFSNYFYVIVSLNAIFDIVMSALLFSLGNFLVNNNALDKYKLYKNLTYIIQMVTIFCSICLLCLYQDFIFIWVGPENQYKDFYVIILFALYFYSSKFRIMGVTFKDAAGMWKNDFLKPYVGIILNIILDILLVNLIGAPGALISTIFIFFFIYYPWETYVLFKDMFMISPLRFILKNIIYFIFGISLACGIYFLSNIFIVDSLGLFVIKLLIVALITILSLVVGTFWTKEFKYFKDKILKLIRG